MTVSSLTTTSITVATLLLSVLSSPALASTDAARSLSLSSSALSLVASSLPSASDFPQRSGLNYTFPPTLYERARRANTESPPIQCLAYDLESGDVAFDLSPLWRKPGEANYVVRDSRGHTYYLNVCGYLNAVGGARRCTTKYNDTHISACQDKDDDSRFPFATGVSLSPSLTNPEKPEDGVVLVYQSSTTDQSFCDNGARRHTKIIFTCGPSRGHPIFLDENDACVYTFKWETDLVCPGADTSTFELSCFVETEQNQIVDLSPLVSSVMNWEVLDEAHGTDTYKYFISVCRPLVPTASLPQGCKQSNMAACQLKTSDSSHATAALGFPASPVYKNGEISMLYEFGETCGSTKVPRRAQIFFSCPASRSKGLGSPKFRQEINCYYIFDWETTAACTTEIETSTTCSVTDDNDNVYDLEPLSAEIYTAERHDVEFRFGVCGAAVSCGGSSAAVCQVDLSIPASPKYTVLASTTSGIQVNDGEVQVSYTSVESSSVQIITTFVCNPAAVPGSEDGQRASIVDISYAPGGKVIKAIVFEVETSTVCVKTIECAIEANGHSYDLSPLARTTYWRVDAEDYSYLINVCQDVNAPSLHCEGTGGCQLTADAKSASALGNTAGPTVEGGNLVLNYRNGSRCGSSDIFRSMTIVFECDKSAGISGSLVALEEKQVCHYEFLWQTSAACPLEEDTDTGCRVTDDRTGQTFDLTSLAQQISHRDIHVTSGSTTYHVGLCGPNSYCGGQVAVCDAAKSSFGQSNTELSFNQDSLFLTYRNGDSCSDGRTKATTVQFRCGTDDGLAGPTVLHDDGCLLELEWATRAACKEEFQTMSCVAYDGKRRFDLSRLIDSQSNYFAEDKSLGLSFEINVCRPILPDASRLCPLGVGACAIGSDKKAFSLGMLKSEPRYDTQKQLVYLNYLNGTNGVSTRIEFVCPTEGEDEDSLNNMMLVGFQEDTNTYVFRMHTQAACQRVIVKGSNCIIQDSITGMKIDLSPLSRATPYELATAGYTYHINVCKPVTCNSKKTTKEAGACQTKGATSVNIGSFNAEPLFENNVLQISYELGEPCHDSTLFRRTVILFVCDLNNESGPEFLREDDCLYLFQWRTQYACKPEIEHCGAIDPVTGAEYHLDALIRKDYTVTIPGQVGASPGNWLALDDDDDPKNAKYAFKLNVCRPLVSDSTITCGPFAAACQTDLASKVHYTIGYPLKAPEVVDGHLRIQYTLGESTGCSAHRTATIQFTCNPQPGALGSPVFEYEGKNCDYYFSWSSSAACPENTASISSTPMTSTSGPGLPGAGCSITNKVTGETIDLSGLGSDGLLSTTGKGPDGTEYEFFVGICQASSKGNTADCAGAGACQAHGSALVALGNTNHHLFYEDDFLVLRYTDGPTCHNKYKRQTTLFLMCDRTATGKPRLEYLEETSDCDYRFEVYTSLVCSRVRQTSCAAIDFYRQDQPKTFDLSSLIQHERDYSVEIPSLDDSEFVAATLDINICRSLVSPQPGCENFYSACLTQGGQRQGQPLGLPASPYVTPDHQVRIDYVSPGCEFGDAPTTNTTIIFQCSSDGEEHQPVLASQLQRHACAFVILWETPLACSDTVTPTPAPSPSPGTLGPKDCVLANEYDSFDLSTLSPQVASNLHDIDGQQYEYRVGVCETFKCGRHSDATVCQTQGDQAWTLGRFTQKPVLEPGHLDQVKLLYENGDECDTKKRTSRITFKCERDQSRQGPVFEDETSTCEYEFTWYTSAVCPNLAIPHQPLGCSVVNPETGYVYHLGDLMRTNDIDENWLARNAAEDDEGDKKFNFYLNVCRPLVPAQITQGVLGEVCRGSAVCQVTESGAQFSGGYAMHEPEFSANGDVILRYSLPSSYPTKCHSKFTRSAVITFTCEPGTLGHPVFVGETAECEYQFTWATSVVCEYKHTAGANCKVSDPETGTVFDLSPLQGGLYTTEAGGYTYELAVCSAPTRSGFSGCNADAGGCQSKRGVGSYNIGRVNARPFLTSGGIGLEYVDGQLCHDRKFKRSTFIEFVCDQSAGDGKPEFLDELEDCSYVFRWRTKHACSMQTDFPCLVTDSQNRQYDLSPLKRLHDNWMVDNTAKADEFTYVLNVCHNVISTGQAVNCSDNAGACQWSAQNKAFYNLGHPAEPKFVNGKLQMTLTGGTPCEGKPRTTVVTFVCKHPGSSGEPLGTPTFDHEDSCTYNIVWETSAACPVNADSGPSTDKCIFEDSETGAVFDMSQLGSLTFTDSRNLLYTLDVCKKFTCNRQQAYGCQRLPNDDEVVIGSTKSVSVADGSISMHITGGSVCSSVSKPREAFITFQCPDDGTQGTQIISVAEERKCSYDIVVRTTAACAEAPRQCIVKDNTHATGWEYDLSPLSVDGSISVQTDEGVIDFNVCRGVSVPGCPSNAGACLTTSTGQHYSLGAYTEDTQPEMMTDKPQVHLIYRGGSCPHGSKASIEITFRCPTSGSGSKNPVFIGSSGCVYQLEWETCRVCPGSNPCEDVRTTPRATTTTRAGQPGVTSTRQASTTGSGDVSGTTGGSHRHKGVAAAVVIIVLLVVGAGAYLMMKPEQRARITSLFSRGDTAPQYRRMKTLKGDIKRNLFDDASSSEEEALFGIDNGDDQGGDSTDDDVLPLPLRKSEEEKASSSQSKPTSSSSPADHKDDDDDDDKPLIPL
eukprot:m.187190 g.187190  ORF g.187190 m.187190 type:complete len:2655 (-) comp16710_c0_seq1:257-8221(-)